MAVGDKETMRTGRFFTVTLPFEAMIVTGNAGRAATTRRAGCEQPDERRREAGEESRPAKHLILPSARGLVMRSRQVF